MHRPFLTAAVAVLALAVLGLPDAQAAARKISLTSAKAKVLKAWRAGYDDGTYAVACARASSRKAVCYLVRTAGTGPDCGRGEAKLDRRGRVTAGAWGYECDSIPVKRWPKGAARPVAGGTAPVGQAPPAQVPVVAPPVVAPPAVAPKAASLSGTYVCLTGIIGQVRPAGPTSIDPVPVPETGLEPPLKFTLKPDGTYSNITFGAAYLNDPRWQGTYTVDGDLVRLVTAGGANLVGGPFRRTADTGGTQYLIEERPANEAYLANVCRRIA